MNKESERGYCVRCNKWLILNKERFIEKEALVSLLTEMKKDLRTRYSTNGLVDIQINSTINQFAEDILNKLNENTTTRKE